MTNESASNVTEREQLWQQAKLLGFLRRLGYGDLFHFEPDQQIHPNQDPELDNKLSWARSGDFRNLYERHNGIISGIAHVSLQQYADGKPATAIEFQDERRTGVITTITERSQELRHGIFRRGETEFPLVYTMNHENGVIAFESIAVPAEDFFPNWLEGFHVRLGYVEGKPKWLRMRVSYDLTDSSFLEEAYLWDIVRNTPVHARGLLHTSSKRGHNNEILLTRDGKTAEHFEVMSLIRLDRKVSKVVIKHLDDSAAKEELVAFLTSNDEDLQQAVDAHVMHRLVYTESDDKKLYTALFFPSARRSVRLERIPDQDILRELNEKYAVDENWEIFETTYGRGKGRKNVRAFINPSNSEATWYEVNSVDNSSS